MAPTRRQAIVWTNDGLFTDHICVTAPQWVNMNYIFSPQKCKFSNQVTKTRFRLQLRVTTGTLTYQFFLKSINLKVPNLIAPLRTQLAMAKRANQPTYCFHHWLNLTEMSPKNKSQIIRRCNMHIPRKDVKCHYLSKGIFDSIMFWVNEILEIAISDSNEYALACEQLESV